MPFYLTLLGLAPVLIGTKVGYIDSNGKYVINPRWDMGHNFTDDGYAKVKINQDDGTVSYGIIDETGKYIVTPAD